MENIENQVEETTHETNEIAELKSMIQKLNDEYSNISKQFVNFESNINSKFKDLVSTYNQVKVIPEEPKKELPPDDENDPYYNF